MYSRSSKFFCDIGVRCLNYSPLGVRSASNRTPRQTSDPPKSGVWKPRPICLRHTRGRSPRRPSVCLPETKCVQLIKLFSAEYLTTLPRFQFGTRRGWKLKFIWFHFNIHSKTARSCTEKRGNLQGKNLLADKLSFELWSKTVTASENTTFSPLIGSKVIRDWVSEESIWSVKRSSDSDVRPKQDCIQCEADRTQSEHRKLPLEAGWGGVEWWPIGGHEGHHQ